MSVLIKGSGKVKFHHASLQVCYIEIMLQDRSLQVNLVCNLFDRVSFFLAWKEEVNDQRNSCPGPRL